MRGSGARSNSVYAHRVQWRFAATGSPGLARHPKREVKYLINIPYIFNILDLLGKG